MFLFLRGIALIVAMMLNCGAAIAADTDSANALMKGCRAMAQRAGRPEDPITLFLTGRCVGSVDGLIRASATTICLPSGVTHGQAILVVVKYIDDRPARLHEDFDALALEALQAAWPCKK